MEFLTDLWLPILLSAAGVFVVSSVVHMCLPVHKTDWAKLPDEEKVLGTLRSHGLRPGMYMFPCAGSMKEASTPEYLAKCNQGPVGTLLLRPNGPCPMGKSLLQWFIFSIVVSALTAYVARITLLNGTGFGMVLRVTGTIATIGYAFSSVCDSIWKGVSWNVTWKYVGDGIAYGLTTGAIFAWMWPELTIL